MSIRQSNPGGIVKPGFNPLGAQTTNIYYDLYSWGHNDQGQIGDSSDQYTLRSSPVQIGSSLNTWSTVASGLRISFALKSDGSLWSWGKGDEGALGDNTAVDKNSPVQVGSSTDWYKISSSAFASIAIKNNGTLWTWGVGSPTGPTLGQNDGVSRSSPTQVGALTTWSKISGGSQHFLLIKTDGTLWTWGNNSYGPLGINNVTYRSSPVQIGALTNWLEVAGGGYFSLAIKTDGTLWGWGRGYAGINGNINTADRSSPVQIGADTDWYKVNAGGEFSIALKTNGTFWAWGRNDFYGSLGDGTKIVRSSPIQVGSLTNWSVAEAGSHYVAALKTDGTLWSWGRNDSGQLGLGNAIDRSSPVQVGAFTDWLALSAGGYHSIALR